MQIDFYVLTESERYPFICRLIETAYQQNHRVFVFCESQQEAHIIDELLWTFRDNSFVPHNLIGEGPNTPPPVQLGYQQIPAHHRDILINLDAAVPEKFRQFHRVIEIVPQDETKKAVLREHFKIYQQAGFKVKTHQE